MIAQLPPLNALRAFAAVARHVSVTKAADELHVTHAAISQQIKVLENYLAVSLVQRTGRNIQLTELGNAYAAALNVAFANIYQATEKLFKKDDAILTVCIPPTLTLRWFIPRLSAFQQAHPEIEVRISTLENQIDFMRESIDVAVYYGKETDWPELHKDFLFYDYIFPVCNPRLLAENKQILSLQTIHKYKLIYVKAELRNTDWSLWCRTMKITEPEKSARLYFETSMQALQAAQAGIGIAMAHEPFVLDELKFKQLVAPFPKKIKTTKNYYLVYPDHSLQKDKVIIFRNWLLNAVKASG